MNRQNEAEIAAQTGSPEGGLPSAPGRPQEKQCVYCGQRKPLSEFKRR
ncbi:hypothetical protein [Gordoniibacillus kamchatkensis]|nr:hypothetical protein [Paenibacillus sp. VKM B-2647]